MSKQINTKPARKLDLREMAKVRGGTAKPGTITAAQMALVPRFSGGLLAALAGASYITCPAVVARR